MELSFCPPSPYVSMAWRVTTVFLQLGLNSRSEVPPTSREIHPYKYKSTKMSISQGLIFSTYDMIYLLTSIEQPPGGSSTAHIYTQTIYRKTKNKKYIEQNKNLELHKNFGRVRAVPHLCGFLYRHLTYNCKKSTENPQSGQKTAVRVEKLQSGQKNCSQSKKLQSGQKNCSHGRKTAVRVEKVQSGQKNCSQGRKTAVRVEKLQSG